MDAAPRCIRLRRPAVLNVHEGVFVPPAAGGDLMREVDQRWHRRREANPTWYDGRVYHVLGVHRNGHGGATLHVIDCAYRFHAVQDEAFDLGVRPLGVKGVVRRGDRALMGRRSAEVRQYPGHWEFAPGGVVEPGREPAEVVRRELTEETGLTATAPPVPLAVLHDPVARCWEVLFGITATGDLRSHTGEYADLQWRPLRNATDEPMLSPIAAQIAAFLSVEGSRG